MPTSLRTLALCAPVLVGTLLVGCASQPNSGVADAQSLYKSGAKLEQSGNTDKAIEEYDRALKIDPKHAATLRAIAHLYTQRQDYTKAVDYWKQFVTATNGSASAYNDLGYCQDLAGWPKQAEVSYRKAIEADPRHLFARVNYGMMLGRHGRGTEALCELQTVLPPAEARYQLGLAYEEVGQRREAQLEFRKALQLDPSFAQAKAHLVAADASAQTE